MVDVDVGTDADDDDDDDNDDVDESGDCGKDASEQRELIAVSDALSDGGGRRHFRATALSKSSLFQRMASRQSL